MYIRNADYSDITDIMILYDYCADYYGLQERHINFFALADLIDRDGEVLFKVAIDDDLETVIGVISAHVESTLYGTTHVWVEGVIASPNYNCGRALIKEVEKYAELHKCKSVCIVAEANLITMGDYLSRMGYRGSGELYTKQVVG